MVANMIHDSAMNSLRWVARFGTQQPKELGMVFTEDAHASPIALSTVFFPGSSHR